jgi:hypothetical protein
MGSNTNSGWLSINRDKYSISEYCVIKKDNSNTNLTKSPINNTISPITVAQNVGSINGNINMLQ